MPRSATTLSAPEAAGELPRWDLTALYPGLDSPEFGEAFQRLIASIEALADLFDELGVGAGAQDQTDEPAISRVERALSALNDVEQAVESTGAYLYGFITTDSRDDLAQARLSRLRERMVLLSKLQTRFTAWIGELPIEEIIRRSPLAAAHAFPLRQLHAAARHLMSEAEEALAAELAPSSGVAWDKLHSNLTSQVTAEIGVDGASRRFPMSEIRNLAMRPERELRQRAWRVELEAWEANAVPIAAALNGVKGQVLVLSARRGWDDPLDETLFFSHLEPVAIEAMLAAAREALPDLRRYLHLKARALELPRLAWYDLFAPVGNAGRAWTWPESARFIEDQFGTFSPRLEGLAARAFGQRWIDAGPRPGKVGGAYCMWLTGDQSRILANFSPGYDGVSTLAHELGHAYHNLNEAGLTPMQRQTPMILAETASTFCETIVKEAALVDADRGERLYILEQSLQGACQIVVDILSRFDFERALFAGRRERELSVNELNRLMLEAQVGTYGDGLDPDALHPYMWAAKGHYYSPELSFYNFPYLFGLLFGFGLYRRYLNDPTGFPERYDDLLASTGRAGAAELAARFDIDLGSEAFWQSSLDVVRADIDRFAALIEG
jgi:pepF/M3 family oligoendopeptidase